MHAISAYVDRIEDLMVQKLAIQSFNFGPYLCEQMLLMRQFDGVEKIKTIGSTYMAASGLRSCSAEHTAVSATPNHSNTVFFTDTSLKPNTSACKTRRGPCKYNCCCSDARNILDTHPKRGSPPKFCCVFSQVKTKLCETV